MNVDRHRPGGVERSLLTARSLRGDGGAPRTTVREVGVVLFIARRLLGTQRENPHEVEGIRTNGVARRRRVLGSGPLDDQSVATRSEIAGGVEGLLVQDCRTIVVDGHRGPAVEGEGGLAVVRSRLGDKRQICTLEADRSRGGGIRRYYAPAEGRCGRTIRPVTKVGDIRARTVRSCQASVDQHAEQGGLQGERRSEGAPRTEYPHPGCL